VIRLLIADDDFDILEGLHSTVNWSSVGVTSVVTARNGKEALEVMRKTPADIVITDVRMPGIDGVELSRLLIETYPDCQVIILSGYSDFKYAQAAMEYGVKRYLVKPVVIRELLEAVLKCTLYVTRKAEFRTLMPTAGPGETSGTKARLAREIKAYILENYDRNIDVTFLSEKFNRTPNYISHVFSKMCGESLIEFLNRVRVENAKQLLLESDNTLLSIASAVGYNDERYFIRIFKRQTGVTPTQFRNEYY